MTTLAAIQGSTWVVVGYDSQVTQDGGRKYSLPSNAGKVAEIGEYLIGAAGDLRAVNILSHQLTPPSPPSDAREDDLDHFMISKFVPSLRRAFDTGGYGKDNVHESQLLIVVNATAYELGENYELIRDKHGFYALGSGSSYALGAMIAREDQGKRTIKAARENIEAAIKIAASLDPGTGEPVMIRTQHWKE